MMKTAYVFDPASIGEVPVSGDGRVFPVRRIFCVGRNYAAHAREMGADPQREPPFFFCKPGDAVCTADVVPWPGLTRELHHEVELVVALGSGGQRIAEADALGCVFGYAVGVDLTRRDLQAEAKRQGRPWDVAKGFDHSAPISPIQPVRGEHPNSGAIALAVNGERRQHGDLSDMLWPVPAIIARLSEYFCLHAGDLVFTGTPEGVAALQPGDRVEAAIDGVGSLRFAMGEAPSAS